MDDTPTMASSTEAEIQAAIDACAAAGHPLKHERYVRRALAARVEQGLAVAIEDPDTLTFLADVFSIAEVAKRASDGCVGQ